MDDNKLLSTKEVASLLSIAPITVHSYVRQGKLKPLYQDKWQSDKTLLFKIEEVEKLKAVMIKPEGMTTGEVAKALDVHISTVNKWVKSGELPAEKKFYKGLEKYFISLEDFEVLKNTYEKQERNPIWTKDRQFALFQSFINDETGEFARLINIEEKEELLSVDGRRILLEDAINAGFKAKYQLNELDYITQRGTATFRLPVQLNAIANLGFRGIDFFYMYVGPKNVKVSYSEQHLEIEVKPVMIKLISELQGQFSEELNLLQRVVVNGDAQIRHNGFLISSDIEKINFHVTNKQKSKLRDLAKTEGMSLDDFIRTIVEKHINEL
ncbi:helix-turn-helix domain-containing protein [Gottfriedia sp. OAE603]|uniref:helix-turn-helix domain-containing protein n=1 Tax=Gottfriedia sp. OAE603 TaxID=2663872 RepID=UPI001789B8FC